MTERRRVWADRGKKCDPTDDRREDSVDVMPEVSDTDHGASADFAGSGQTRAIQTGNTIHGAF